MGFYLNKNESRTAVYIIHSLDSGKG